MVSARSDDAPMWQENRQDFSAEILAIQHVETAQTVENFNQSNQINRLNSIESEAIFRRNNLIHVEGF